MEEGSGGSAQVRLREKMFWKSLGWLGQTSLKQLTRANGCSMLE